MGKVVISECHHMDKDEIKTQLLIMLKEIEKESPIIREGMKVVIKPNLVSARNATEAVTTHPVFLAALIEILMDRKCNLSIVESPAGKMDEIKMKTVYQKCGLTDLVKMYPVKLSLTSESVQVYLPHLKIKVPILKSFQEADLVIGCSKCKTHSYTVFTGATKNYFGMMPGLVKAQMHARFPRKSDFGTLMCDLASLLPHQLNIMEAIEGMHKAGPTNGEKIQLNRLFMSKSPYALDDVAMRYVKIDPRRTPIGLKAIQLGYCEESELCYCSKMSPVFESKFIVPNNTGLLKMVFSVSSRIEKNFSPKPKVDENRCIGCGECVRDCPAQTIEIENHHAKINPKKCIRCYCCQEVCSVGAIWIKKI